MPLSRYALRSEYSLANPDLYRAADKDDPEGLLEGVAMAGLVGIIRQLGDLAEFAAEVFHDLHEDVLAIASRGHELFERIQHLETEISLIEKMMLTKIDNRDCFYNQGLEWHIYIYNDQNHFTRGDLPHFIQSAYEDCRSPPRLFTLDRYDVAGDGSCLKRFTGPSFFRMEWASSELRKAEKEQQDQKARRMKRKGERQAHGAREAKIALHIKFRMLSEVDNTESLGSPSSASDSSLDSLTQRAVDSLENDVRLASGVLVSEQKGPQSKTLAVGDFVVKGLPSSFIDMQKENSTLETASHVDVGVLKDLKNDVGIGEVVADDPASETDNFVDAVATIDSEVEADSEIKKRAEVEGEFLVGLEEEEAPAVAFELQKSVDHKKDEVDGELPVESEEVEALAPASFQLRGGTDDVTKEDLECYILEEDKGLVIEEDKEGLIIEEDITSEEDKGALVTEESKGYIVIEEDKEGLVIEEDKDLGDLAIVEDSVSEEDKVLVTEEDEGGLVIEEDKDKGDLAIEEDKEVLATEEDKGGLVIEEDKYKGDLAIEEDIVSEDKGGLAIEEDKDKGDLAIEEDVMSEDKYKGDIAIEEDNEVLVTEEDKGGLVIEEDVASEEDKGGLVIEEDIASEESLSKEHVYFVPDSPEVSDEVEDGSFVDGSVVVTSVQDNDDLTPNNGCVTSSPILGDNTVTKPEGYAINNTPNVFAKEEDLSSVDKSDDAMLSVKDKVLASISQGNASSLGLEEDDVLDAQGHLQFGSTTLVLKTPEALEADNIENFLEKNVSADFNHGLVNNVPQTKSPKDLGSGTKRKRWQISNLLSKEILLSNLERNSLQAPEGEQSDSPTKLSLQSSPSSSIQPMKWEVDLSRSYHTDDEMEGMQVPLESPASSSSTLSSPRPSTLATTILNMSLEHKPEISVDSSPQSRSLKSGIKTAPSQSTSQVKITSEPLSSLDFGCSIHSSPHSLSSAEEPFFDPLPSLALNFSTSSTESPTKKLSAQSPAATNLEIFPPPPPLPPLAWCMTKRTHNPVVNPLKPMESPTPIPIPFGVRALPDELPRAFGSSTALPIVPHSSNVELNEPTHSFNSPTIGEYTSQKSEGILDESMQSSMYETGQSDPETLHGRSDNLPQVSEPAKSHDRGPPLANADTIEQGTALDLETLDTRHSKGEIITTVGPGSSLQDKFIDDSTCVILPHVLQTGSIPARLDESRLELQTEAAVECGLPALQRNELPSAIASNFGRNDSTEATTSHDTSRLKMRSKWALTSSTASSDDREVLLDQIRTRSYRLRNTSREKLAPPRPAININVAAILEKANAIRQAFAGSDDDDDEEWSDA